MSWIQEIIETHKELESPDSFWFWSALAALSAVLKDRVYFNKQIYNVYPNIYVMLHADSGVKKGPPVNMAKKFVTAVNNTRVISGRYSIQGLLKELGTAYTVPGKGVVTGSNAFICSSELTSSIVEDKVANSIFTDLYDRNYNEGAWKHILKMENFELKDPCITMLTATNESHSDEYFTNRDVQGGYFARTFVIYEKQTEKINSLMYPLVNPPDNKKAIAYLKEVEKLEGPLEMDISTRAFFDEWYKDFRATIKGVKDATGTLNRFDDSVLKIAILLSIAKKPEKFISREAVDEAIAYCEKLVGNIRRASLGKGSKKESTPLKAFLIETLLARPEHRISRALLNKKYWTQANDQEWDQIIASLESGKHLVIENVGSQVIYRMPEHAVKWWTDFMAGKIQKEQE